MRSQNMTVASGTGQLCCTKSTDSNTHLQFEECLKRELAVAEKDKAAFIKEFSESDYNAIEAGWKVSCTS